MVKRLISNNPQAILKQNAQELKASIRASEGRIIMAETIVTSEAYVEDLTNAELARAGGADLILLNLIDVQKPQIKGLWEKEGYSRYASVVQDEAEDIKRELASSQEMNLHSCISRLKELVACPIGINLEPIDTKAIRIEQGHFISQGRQALVENFKLCEEAQVDFLLLTGNPQSGVTVESILEAIKEAKKYYKGLIFAGKMHGSGVGGSLAPKEHMLAFIEAGADAILLPVPGTVPGFTEKVFQELTMLAKERDCLVVSAIGTSQESASTRVIEQFALTSKQAGVDIHHIGDGGYGGLAPVENIFTLSKTVRGLKHTLSRIARSIRR